MSENRPDPFVGRTFDGYRIESVIGRGGMGTVYKADQLSLGRPVAIKILAPDLVRDEQFLERFHREAEVLSRLSHPNVVAVYDRGEVDGQPYLAMEYVEGPSLRDVLREGPLEPAEALRIVSSVLAALEHAHRSGVVHRDIKPENVLLARGEVVKVADFGLSRLVESADATRLTRTQLVLGTYEYMAPEQREHSREADSRSDLYATGVVLYEMLTGELPIGRFDLPSRRRPDQCDGRLDRIVERSLEKDPERRYQRAGEMADAVSAVLEHPAPEPPPRRASPFPPPFPFPFFKGPRDYKPIRFEYHIDNLATIDHVLGTVCYALAVFALFGAGMVRVFGFGAGFLMMILAGWYLRSTAADLRRYKAAARTAQAVIAILAAFTLILIPFSIYSLWVLFSHRGRTYYDARGRGLNEREAARHTYRMLEEPYPLPRTRPPAAPETPPAPPPAPRPSQIPVQSVVTSEVTPRGAAAASSEAPRRPHQSAWVTAGMLLLGAVIAGAALAHVEGTIIPAPLALILAAAPAVLLSVGFFHSLVTPGVTGAAIAFALILLYALLLLLHFSGGWWQTEFPNFRGMFMGSGPGRCQV